MVTPQVSPSGSGSERSAFPAEWPLRRSVRQVQQAAQAAAALGAVLACRPAVEHRRRLTLAGEPVERGDLLQLGDPGADFLLVQSHVVLLRSGGPRRPLLEMNLVVSAGAAHRVFALTRGPPRAVGRLRWGPAAPEVPQIRTRLRRVPPDGPVLSVPAAMMTPVPTAAAPLVGRDRELDELAGLAGVVAPPGGGAVLLGGDAGIGKSRLLAALAGRAEAAGWEVAVGHCLDLGGSPVPYLPFTELASRLAAERPERVAELAGRYPSVRRLVASGARRRPASRRTAGCSSRPCTPRCPALAAEQPLLVVVEDLHWADQSTYDLLTFLLTRGFTAPVALVGVLPQRRPAPPPPAAPAARRLEPAAGRPPARARAAARRRRPRRWSGRCAPGDLGRAAAGRDRPGRGERVLRRGAGRGHRRVGHPARPGRPPAAAGRPARARRPARGPGARGRRPPALRRAARARSPGSGRTASRWPCARRSTATSSLGDRDGYGFRHSMLGEAIEADLLPGERARLHDAFTAALAGRTERGASADLARHALAAGRLPEAFTASVRAGDEAAAVGGPDEAARHYARALDLVVRRAGSAGRRGAAGRAGRAGRAGGRGHGGGGDGPAGGGHGLRRARPAAGRRPADGPGPAADRPDRGGGGVRDDGRPGGPGRRGRAARAGGAADGAARPDGGDAGGEAGLDRATSTPR